MHKRLLNEAVIDLTISPKGPILIKSGLEGADPSRPDMEFVRTNHAELGETVYLPGSSLKGVVRSYCEKIARTVGAKCCNPFDDSSCGKKVEEANKKRDNNLSGDEIYANVSYACRICKIFGSTGMSSRIKFNDAYPNGKVNIEQRTNVAIDRIMGSVAAGPFDMEVVTSGSFSTKVTLKNFELWQMGLLGLALRDMEKGRVRLGFAKSRGLGEIEVKVNSLEIRYPGMKLDGNSIKPLNGSSLTWNLEENGKTRLLGIGQLATSEEKEAYRFDNHDEIMVEGMLRPVTDWMAVRFELNSEEIRAYFKAAVNDRWVEVIKNDHNR